jgi:hypothetical protein
MRTFPLRAAILTMMAASTLLACRGGESDDGSAAGSTESDWVVQSAFDRAFTVVKGIDYLPFQYKVDGCYARALYMSMELASNGMESNAVFAFAQPGAPLVVGPIQWGYHVAPMIEVGTTADNAVHTVIDPALSDHPITQEQWVAMMGHPADEPASQQPQMLFVPGSDYAPAEAIADTPHANFDTPNFHDLAPFKSSDIQGACGVMHKYLTLEQGSSPDEVQRKQTKLVARSTALVAALAANGKLTVDVEFSAETCAGSP